MSVLRAKLEKLSRYTREGVEESEKQVESVWIRAADLDRVLTTLQGVQEPPRRCEGRYPVPQTSPPRAEPFGVTYRCASAEGHDGPCGANRVEPIASASSDRTEPIESVAAQVPHPERTEPPIIDWRTPNDHDAQCEAESTSHGYTPCRCAERAAARAPQEPPADEHITNCHCGRCHCGYQDGHPVYSLACCQAEHRTNAVKQWQRTVLELTDTIKALREAQEARPAPPLDWQPMATAPKDDSIVFITNGKFVSPCHFTEGAWYEMNNDPSDAWGRPIYEHEVTHWMPLPDPPAAVPQAAPQE